LNWMSLRQHHATSLICAHRCLYLSTEVSCVLQSMTTFQYPRSGTTRYGRRSFVVSGRSTLWNTLPPTMYDPSLSLTQFCALMKTMLFYRAYETLRHSTGCKDCCTNTNVPTYFSKLTSHENDKIPRRWTQLAHGRSYAINLLVSSTSIHAVSSTAVNVSLLVNVRNSFLVNENQMVESTC